MRLHLRFHSCFLTFALSFPPVIATATTISGLYIDGGAGYNLVQDQHVHANMPITTLDYGVQVPGYALPKFTVNHNAGFTGFGAVGYGFGNGLRVEAEGLYNNSEDHYTQTIDEAKNYPNKSIIDILHFNKSNNQIVQEMNGSSINPCGDQTNTCFQNASIVQKVTEIPGYIFFPPKNATNVLNLYETAGIYKTPVGIVFAFPQGNSEVTASTGSWTPPPAVSPYLSSASATTWAPMRSNSYQYDCNDCYVVTYQTPAYSRQIEEGPLSTGESDPTSYQCKGVVGTALGMPESCLLDSWNLATPLLNSPWGKDAQLLGNNDKNIVANYESYEASLIYYKVDHGILPKGIYVIGPGIYYSEVSAHDHSNSLTYGVPMYSSKTHHYYLPTIDTGSTVLNLKNLKTTAHYVPPGPRTVQYHGQDQSYGGFFNVLYDFDLERLFGVKSIVTPFVGGGAGYLWQRYNRPNTMFGAITGTHGGFAWQGIIGVAFDTGIRGLQITAQYRMIGQPGSFYNGGFTYNVRGGATGSADFDQRFNHQFIVGFRYAFQNQPIHHIQPPAVRPMVAAEPAPVPARSYLVFFDWNQYALTSRARQIVVEAAHATSYVHTTRINVNGYTVSSATPGPAGQKYNYALSVKRAKSVEAELIRNGVPASEIVIRGYGDTNPLVPTAPNTREPQNRRVEIILHA